MDWVWITENKANTNIEILDELNIQMEPLPWHECDGINQCVVKDFADIIARPVLVIFERHWYPGDKNNENIIHVSKKVKKKNPRRLMSLT